LSLSIKLAMKVTCGVILCEFLLILLVGSMKDIAISFGSSIN
jgi:hypothetical protein